MHHLSAFSGSVASGAADAVLPGLTDSVFAVRNSGYQYGQDRKLLGSYLGGADLLGGKIDYPSALASTRPLIYPIDKGTIGGNLAAVDFRAEKGLILPGREDIRVLVSREVQTAAQGLALLWTAARIVPAPSSSIFTVKATAAITNGTYTWAPGTLTLDASLPAGRYAVVGAAATGTGLLAVRFTFLGQSERPGVMAQTDSASYHLPFWRYGNAGLFGTFENVYPPSIETLGSGSGTAQDVYLDLVKVG